MQSIGNVGVRCIDPTNMSYVGVFYGVYLQVQISVQELFMWFKAPTYPSYTVGSILDRSCIHWSDNQLYSLILKSLICLKLL
jgi:hypothetical protein